MKYAFVFLTYVLFFTYLVYGMIVDGFGVLDLTLFALFIILAMLGLILSEKRVGWTFHLVIFAFLLNYTIFLFLHATTAIRFLLIVLTVCSFIVSAFSLAQPDTKHTEAQ